MKITCLFLNQFRLKIYEFYFKYNLLLYRFSLNFLLSSVIPQRRGAGTQLNPQNLNRTGIINFKFLSRISLIMFLAMSAQSQTSASSLPFCRSLFSQTEEFPESLFPENFTNPLTQTILREHFTAKNLHWFDKMKIADFTKGLSHLTEFSENPAALSEETRVFFEKAAAKVPEIMEFAKTTSPDETPHFQQITLTVLATFSKHLPEALAEGKGADWSRISLILRHIAAFDRDKPRWSLHKINRAIKGRYDPKEYIECRIL